jgi:hypothetical protein
MKPFLFFLLSIAFLASCRDSEVTPSKYSQIATIKYKSDTFFMIEVQRSYVSTWNSNKECWKITDTSLLKWNQFPVVLIESNDSDVILRGKFFLYDIKTQNGKYAITYNDYFTNGVECLVICEEGNNVYNKIGDSAYIFYQKRATFRPKQIK